MNDNLHQLRCFGCGSRIAGAEARADFRCANCGDLFEVEYPGWSQRGGQRPPESGRAEVAVAGASLLVRGAGSIGRVAIPRAAADSGQFWQCRVACARAIPRSIICRASAKALGIDQLYAKHQGMNPTGSFKDTGMTAALSVAKERGFTVGGMRIDREHVGGDGRVCGARGNAQPGADSRRQDCVGQTVAGDGLRRGDLPGEDRLRRLPACADRDREDRRRSIC